MKLTIFGATGGTGLQLVRQTLQAGYDVTAVVRGESTRLAAEEHPRLRVVRADVMDPADIAPYVADRDAVVSVIGPRERGPTSVCTDSVASIVAAMDKAGTNRLVAISASGPFVDGDGPMTRWIAKPLLRRTLRHAFADFLGLEAIVRDTALDWTIMRPPMLTNGPRTGTYRTASDRNVRSGFRVSRADLADCILAVLRDPRTVHTAVSVGY